MGNQNFGRRIEKIRHKFFRSHMVELALMNHMGNVRRNNEDNYYFCGKYEELEHFSMARPYSVKQNTVKQIALAVFDGMGGENAGELASYTAAKTFSREVLNLKDYSIEKLYGMVKNINSEVCNAAREGKHGQIGTTATMLFLEGEMAYLVNIGDSPAYLMREGGMEPIAHMHTDEVFLIQNRVVGRKPQLTQFIGIPEEDMILVPHTKTIKLKKGDVFLLCSDGVTDMLPEEEIFGILQDERPLSHIAGILCSRALTCGGKDNITILLCKVR